MLVLPFDDKLDSPFFLFYSKINTSRAREPNTLLHLSRKRWVQEAASCVASGCVRLLDSGNAAQDAVPKDQC